MPLWLLVVIGAHLLNAVAFLVDKYLLARSVPKPSVYAFSVGGLGVLAFALLPFDWHVPTPAQALLDFAAGATFVFALLCFFSALKRGEASRIVPYVGGTIPIWTLLFAYLALGERLSGRELTAFLVLLLGSAFIARGAEHVGAPRQRVFAIASLAALSFAVSSVLMKAIFLEQSFLAGFVWSRIGGAVAAASILLHPASRRAIFHQRERPSGTAIPIFLAGQLAGALGLFTLQYAVSLASPTLVNALQGVQYAFLFLFAVILGRRFPQLRERLSQRIVLQRVLAILVIAIGLAMLVP